MHFRRLWNGMFDRHRAEITVMQFTVQPCPILSAKLARANGICTSAVFGMACLAGSEVDIQHEYLLQPKTKTHVRKVERIPIKSCWQNVPLLSNQTCLNEGLLPNYTHTHTHTHIYIYIYMCVCVCACVCVCVLINKVNIVKGLLSRKHYLWLHLFQGS